MRTAVGPGHGSVGAGVVGAGVVRVGVVRAGLTLLALSGLALPLAGCGGSDRAEQAGVTAGPGRAEESPSPTQAPSAAGPSESRLPGEPFEIAPERGSHLGVVGVRFDDVLTVRRVPGSEAGIVASAGPTASDLVATGRARLLAGSIWDEVRIGGVTGWVNASYVAGIGAGIGVTPDVVQALGRRPTAPTMLALGRVVAGTRASEADPTSRVTVTVAPTPGARGTVTYDVIGVGDDALAGERLKVVGQRMPGGYRLADAEATLLCARHVDEETGLCV